MDVAREPPAPLKLVVENFRYSCRGRVRLYRQRCAGRPRLLRRAAGQYRELSVQFKKLGLSADDMFTIFANGAGERSMEPSIK